MQSSINFTFKMVIYGAIILALTTFYGIERVKAENVYFSFNSAIVNSNGTYVNTITTPTSTFIGTNNYIGISIPYGSSTNVNGGTFYLPSDVWGKYLGKDIVFTGIVYDNRTPINLLQFDFNACDLQYFTNEIVNGQQTDVPNKRFAKFTCKTTLTRVDPRLNFGLNTTGINFSNNSYIGFTALQIFESDSQKIDDTKKEIKDTNDTLKDDNIDTNSTANAILVLENSLGLDTNFITSLIILPYNLLNTLYSNANVCSSINLGNLFNSELVLPCIDIEDYIGSTLYNLIDIIMCGVCAMGFVNALKKLLDKVLTLSSDIEETADIKIFK